MSDHRGPVLIEIDEDAPSPAAAPPIDEAASPPEGRAMQVLSTLGRKRRGSWLTRWFWGGVVALLGFVLSIAAWDFATGLLTANPVLGGIATGLIALVVVTLLLIALRELAAFSRLGRLDALHREAAAALAADDVKAARGVLGRLDTLYRGRANLRLAREEITRRRDENLRRRKSLRAHRGTADGAARRRGHARDRGSRPGRWRPSPRWCRWPSPT